ncbi:MAG TPA: XRE family transcriptional regulator [Cytophagales bacterium]|jgi:transcriptional regulator with XRE-family HTH domain|nr:XRE family transcriptional regulator [Cytophagales bacterium]
MLPSTTSSFPLGSNEDELGDRIASLRKTKGVSQTDLAKSVNASREAIGKYERNEAMPSVETAKKIADVFEVTLDYLVDENSLPTFDKKTVNRLKDIQLLSDDDKKHVFALLDAFLARTKIQSIIQ